MIKMLDVLKLVTEYGEVRVVVRDDNKMKYFRDAEFDYYIERTGKVAYVRTVEESELDTEPNDIKYRFLVLCFDKLFNRPRANCVGRFWFENLWNWCMEW
jgi:hypothetical protein